MKHDGGPAFPARELLHVESMIREDGGHGAQEVFGYAPGMTLRDWFAGTATDDAADAHRTYAKDGHQFTLTREQARYRYADAMIKARGDNDEA